MVVQGGVIVSVDFISGEGKGAPIYSVKLIYGTPAGPAFEPFGEVPAEWENQFEDMLVLDDLPDDFVPCSDDDAALWAALWTSEDSALLIYNENKIIWSYGYEEEWKNHASFKYFEDSGYEIYYTIESHNHTFVDYTLSEDGTTITATCTAEDCPLDDGSSNHIAALTIGMPTASDGKAVITDEAGMQGAAKVMYQTKNGADWSEETETPPTADGFHRASVTVGGKTASVTYGMNCITYATGLEHGTVSGASGATVGAAIEPTITPDEGYEIDTLTVTGENSTPVTVADDNLSFTMPEDNVTVSATFKLKDYAVGGTFTNGAVTAQKNNEDVTTANYGDSITLVVTPDEGYAISGSVTVTDAESNPVTLNDDTFTMPVSDVTVSATFAAIDYTVTVTQPAAGGTIGVDKTNGAHRRYDHAERDSGRRLRAGRLRSYIRQQPVRGREQSYVHHARVRRHRHRGVHPRRLQRDGRRGDRRHGRRRQDGRRSCRRHDHADAHARARVRFHGGLHGQVRGQRHDGRRDRQQVHHARVQRHRHRGVHRARRRRFARRDGRSRTGVQGFAAGHLVPNRQRNAGDKVRRAVHPVRELR